MKLLASISLVLALLVTSNQLQAQNSRIVIDDQLELIDANVKPKLKERLASKNITIEESVIYSEKCEYWYVVFLNTGKNDRVQLRNCNERIIAAKDIESMVKDLGPIERSIILASNINDLVEKANGQKQATEVTQVPPPVVEEVPEYFTRQQNEHNTRYLFSPSAYNLRKAELYYNTVGFVSHDIQLGVTDNFSIGMGTTIAFTPLYVTPKISFSIDQDNHVSVGDLFIAGTYNNDFIANLAYANYTYGSPNNNFTIGGGMFSYDGDNRFVGNIGLMTQISRHLYFVTEHYHTTYKLDHHLYASSPGPNMEDVTLNLNNNIIIGHLGVRYVSKEVDVRSWHFGVAYFLRLEESFDGNQYPGYFGTESATNFLILPSFAFTYKIGKKL